MDSTRAISDDELPGEEAPISFDFSFDPEEDVETTADYLQHLNDAASEAQSEEFQPDAKDEDDSLSEQELDEANGNGVSEEAPHSTKPSSHIEIRIGSIPPELRGRYLCPPPSDFVGTVLERIPSVPGEEWFKVEFDDGRIDQVAFDDLLALENGHKALHIFRKREAFQDEDTTVNFSNNSKKRKTRHDPDYESDNSSDDEMDIDEDGGEDSRFPDDNDEDADDGVLPFTRRSRRSRPGLATASDRGRVGTRQSSRLASTEDDEERESNNRKRRLRSRPARSLAVANGKLVADDDIDELAGDDSGDFFLVKSDLQPSKSKRKKKRPKGRPPRQFRESSIEFEYRRSSRATKNTKNMADSANVDDDSLYVQEDKAPGVPKVVSMREVFQPLTDSDFKDVHSTVCDTCGVTGPSNNKGQLIFCQGCSLSYHKVCLGYRHGRDHLVTKVGPEHFVLQCRYCIGIYKNKDSMSPKHDVCQVCGEKGPACRAFSARKTARQEEKLRKENDGVDPITVVSDKLINKAENVLFRCSLCRCGYHFEHLPAPSDDWIDSDEADIRAERLAEYSIDWKCKECVNMDAKVDVLVAWRPVDRAAYRPDQTSAELDEDSKEYLIKWEHKSYAHCVWKPGAWVWGVTSSRMRAAFAKRNNGAGVTAVLDANDAIPEEYLLADVILAVRYEHPSPSVSKQADMDRIGDLKEIRLKFQGLGYDETVWDNPPPRVPGKRWEAFEAAYYEFLNGKHFKNVPASIMAERIKDFQSKPKFKELEAQPPGLLRGKLMEYQMEGLNWLLFNFYKGKSVILADEMGLGKTVQVVALVTSLVQDQPQCWPFLIVVPNSTCPNWRREIKNWSPDLRVVTYHGGRIPQALAYDHELFPNGSRDMKAHVVVMSYDSAQDEETRRKFKSVRWAGLVVDEGQRLKNDQNLLYGALRSMKINFRLLLTGTPLQNNKRELFNLLQFIDSSQNAAALDEKYAEITAENLPELHQLIRPYFLRRTKAEVLKFLPPMAQIIVPVTMSVVQEKLAISIMNKNPDLIRAIFAKGKVKVSERGSLNNILMQLRKCLCHPFIYSEAIEEKNVDPERMFRNLIEASGKLLLLEIMLPKLKERGHRVLLFSQFLNQLDIIEDFLNGLGLRYQRLDGNMSSLEKQRRIDEFNAPDSELFAFLLSTRAGGVGINLATADTVIILDPDFNPHQDIQALSRAHRIGQKKKVLCFQFMTKDSVEEKIMQIGRKKMALDHALIESMDADDDAGTDLESILKHGAEALFSENEKVKITYDSASVDKLLDRSQIENTRTDENQSAESQFSFARVWANDKGALTDELDVAEESDNGNLSVWDSIIKEREEAARRAAEQNKEVLGRGGRRRNAVRYSAPKYEGLEDGHAEGGGASSDDDNPDADFHVNNEDGEDSGEEEDGDLLRAAVNEALGQAATAAGGKATPRTKTPGTKTPVNKASVSGAASATLSIDLARNSGVRPQAPQTTNLGRGADHSIPATLPQLRTALPVGQTPPLEVLRQQDILLRKNLLARQLLAQYQPMDATNQQQHLGFANHNNSIAKGQSVQSMPPRVMPTSIPQILPVPSSSNAAFKSQLRRRPPPHPAPQIPQSQNTNSNGNIPNGSSRSGTPSRGPTPCMKCGISHRPNTPCQPLRSERDVRLAIDALRSAPGSHESKEALFSKLLEVTKQGTRTKPS